MISILWVDDDQGLTKARAEHLRNKSQWEVVTAFSAQSALAIIRTSRPRFSAIVLDVIMPAPRGWGDERCVGVELARRVRKFAPTIPILGVSGEEHGREYFENQKRMAFLAKDACTTEHLVDVLGQLMRKGRWQRLPNIFIVHGHDHATTYALKSFLERDLHLGEPIILHEQPNLGRALIEKFEECSAKADVVFALLTPDDLARSRRERKAALSRARQNVIFELGYFYGKLRRRSGAVILLFKGSLELPSDLAGVAYIDLSDGFERAAKHIRAELRPWLRH